MALHDHAAELPAELPAEPPAGSPAEPPAGANADAEQAQSASSAALLNDRYRLLELIGRGGMARVFRARDEFLGRDVAVKIFSATASDQVALGRTEVKVLASLNHHGLVTLFDVGVDRSDPKEPHIFIVMELVGGMDLAEKLSGGPMSSRQVAQLGSDIAEALEYIHHRGIVHRDVKPANIMMVEYGDDDIRARAKLMDFGIAIVTGGDAGLEDNSPLGTAAYLSPEQALDEVLTPASDVYSLGLMLLESLTGTLAFPGAPLESAAARLAADPVIPDSLSIAWKLLLEAMTSRDPANRPFVRDIILALKSSAIEEAGKHRADHGSTLPADEAGRLEAIRRYEILETPPDGAFDRITSLAARFFSAPIAIVSVVDHDRIWFASSHGMTAELDQIERAPGLCASAILHDEPWVVEDARQDPRALANPLVAGEFGLQFYAGVPLRTHDGHNLGTLCVLDFEPRTALPGEIAALEDLAALVMSDLELRLATRRVVSGQRR